MATRKVKRRVKEAMGLTPSSRDEAQQTTSSGQPAQMSQGTLQANLSDASGTNQVSGSTLLL